MTLSDRVGILNEGRLIQEGPPHEIYEIYERRRRPSPPASSATPTCSPVSPVTGGIVLADGARLWSGRPPGPDGRPVTCAVRPGEDPHRDRGKSGGRGLARKRDRGGGYGHRRARGARSGDVPPAPPAPAAGRVNVVSARVLHHVFGGAAASAIWWTGRARPLKVFVQNRTGEVIPEGTAVRLTWSPRDTVVVAP